MIDWSLRHRIYRHLATTGEAPARRELIEWVGGDEAVDVALRALHDAHLIVLDDDGSLRMALPFSAVPTSHRVRSGERAWWANCAWDALAIPIALGIDAAIEATWLDDGAPVELAVVGGRLSSTEGHVHVAVPARRWWDDIVET